MIPLLFIYQPNTIAKAIALPGDALPSMAVITLVPPTLTEVDATTDVAVTTPVT